MRYKNPSVTVDGIIERNNEILLIKRGREPFKGMWALPGGFVEYGEIVEDAVKREIKEETGLITEVRHLLGVYSKPDRDPRGHTISIVFVLDVLGGKLKEGDDASDTRFFSVGQLPNLAFDHKDIIKDYLRRKDHDMS